MLKADELRMLYRFVLLVMLAVLAMMIALGKAATVETSYGLLEIATILSVLAGSFAQWAFGSTRNSGKDQPADESSSSQKKNGSKSG